MKEWLTGRPDMTTLGNTGRMGDAGPRLIEIIRKLGVRITEARANGWLGEVQGLQVSLTDAKTKLISLDRSLERTRNNQNQGPTDLGMPVITRPR